MRVLFRPEAVSEVLDAQRWYEARSPGLGFEFARSVEVAVATVSRDPNAYPTIELDCRRVLLRRFPYSLVYRARAEELLVIAVFHHRRASSTLTQRMAAVRSVSLGGFS